MMRLVGILVLMAGVWSGAAAQELPRDVTDPYLDYTRAVEAEDYEAARDAALEAWNAGRRLSIGPDTLAILGDNYAQLASALGEHEAARDTYRAIVDLLIAENEDAARIAATWILAARSALAAGDHGDALRCADTAGDLAERSEAIDDRTRPALLFASRSIQAQVHWSEGRVRLASARAREVMDIAERDGMTDNSRYGFMAFILGADHAMDREFEDAAFYMTQAYAYLPEQRRALAVWLRWARHSLDEAGRARLFDRIAAADFPPSERPPSSDRDSPISALREAGAFVDAVAVRRSAPAYPQDAINGRFDGVAVIEFTVNEEGRVEDPEVVVTIPFLDFGDAGLRAVRRWRYEPATVDGVPVSRPGMVIQFEFKIFD